MMEMMGEIMAIMNDVQGEELEIKELNVITLQKSNGVLLQLTSPDPDGVKLAKMLSKIMAKFPEMVKSGNPNIKVTFKELSEE